MDELFQNEDYRKELANAYLASVVKKEIEFSNRNLFLIRNAASILLGEDQKTAPSVEGGAVW